MVPSGWSYGRIDEFFVLQRGYDLTSKNRVEGSIPVYSSSGLAYYHNEAKVVAPGVVTGRKGSVGQVFLIEEDFWPHDTTLWVKDFKNNDPKFITYFLKAQKLERFDEASSVPTLNRNNVHRVKTAFPPLDEQRGIVKVLSTWDKAISTTEKLIEMSKQQKKALMQQLLTGKKRLVNPETGKTFEGRWEDTLLNQLAVITMGSSPKSEAYNEIGEGLPLLQGNADIKFRKSAPRIYTSQITKKCSVGDILLSVRAPVGSVAKSLHDACIGRGIASIQAKKNIVKEFVYQWLLSFEPKWGMFSQGSTFEAVNSNDIKTLQVSIPIFAEQQQIASVLTIADKEIEVLEAKLAHFKQEKKALMQQLLTGKRRVVVDAA